MEGICGDCKDKLTPDNCLDCAMERQEYGAMYCPIHYMLVPDVGDSLYNYQDKTLYLITYITDKHITMENTQGNKITLENNATTLSNFKLIKSHD